MADLASGDIVARMSRLKVEILSAKVLIVDDMSLMRKVIGGVLEVAGFANLYFAEDGKQALEMVNEIDPDLVILDLNMPHMSGLDVCKHLKSNEETADIPIIVQSMFETPEDRNIAFSAGAIDYICKPINPPELLARVSTHLANRVLIDSLARYRQQLDAELSIARDMLQNLIPGPEEIKRYNEKYGLKVQGLCRASSELGGDIWGLKALSDDQMGFFILDVRGHGVAAALNTVRFHQELEQVEGTSLDAKDVVSQINNNMATRMQAGQFSALLYGIVNLSENSLCYASAAHPSPFHISGGLVSRCMSDDHLVGLKAGLAFESHTIPFAVGDRFFAYNDALIETKNDQGNFMGEEGIHEYLDRMVKEKKNSDYFTYLRRFFRRHYSHNLKDDLTMVNITRV